MKYVRDIPFKEFVDSHHRAVDEDLAELRRSNEDESVPLIFTETEEILSLLIGLTHPDKILEIGTAHVYSALFFAKKLPDARIVTIERNPVMIEAAAAEFASRKEGERIDFRTGDASEILNGLVCDLADGQFTLQTCNLHRIGKHGFYLHKIQCMKILPKILYRFLSKSQQEPLLSRYIL